MPNYRYFTHPSWQQKSGGYCPILVCTDDVGMFFFGNGNSYSNLFKSIWGINYLKVNCVSFKDYIEINLSSALNLLFSHEARNKVLKFLKISDLDSPPTIQEQNDIINKLRTSRAFNADSAFNLGSLHSFYMLEKGLIKECEGKFYIEKDREFNISVENNLTQGVLNV